MLLLNRPTTSQYSSAVQFFCAFAFTTIIMMSTFVFAAEKPTEAVTLPKEASSKFTPIITPTPTKMQQILYHFDSPTSVDSWQATDDRVMGGVSQSRMRFDAAGHAVFEGVMSLDNNGGFASVRAASPTVDAAVIATPSLPLDYVLTVRGDGKRYKLNLRVAGKFDAVSYQAGFETTADTWVTVRIPVSRFQPTFRGRRVNAPPLDPMRVREAGLMIADEQQGRFALHIKSIAIARETR